MVHFLYWMVNLFAKAILARVVGIGRLNNLYFMVNLRLILYYIFLAKLYLFYVVRFQVLSWILLHDELIRSRFVYKIL